MKNLSLYSFVLYARLVVCCILIIFMTVVTGNRIYHTEIENMQNELAYHDCSRTLNELVRIYNGRILCEEPKQKISLLNVNGHERSLYWEGNNDGDLETFNYNGQLVMSQQAFLDYFQISEMEAEKLERSYAQANADQSGLGLLIALCAMAVCFQVVRVIAVQTAERIGGVIYITGTVVNGLLWTGSMIYQGILSGIVVAFLAVLLLMWDIKHLCL